VADSSASGTRAVDGRSFSAALWEKGQRKRRIRHHATEVTVTDASCPLFDNGPESRQVWECSQGDKLTENPRGL